MSIEVWDANVPQGQCESPEEEKVQTSWETNLDVIRAKLKNPDYDVCELMRLVTLEIATLALHVRLLGFTVEEVHIIRCLGEGLKGLRELRHSIMDAESVRKRTDVINWEGEAIEHVLRTYTRWFSQALKDSGYDDAARNDVLRHFRDVAAMNEAQLYRETEGRG